MDREEQIMSGIWDLFNKKMWLDGVKMKDRFQGFHPTEIHCIEFVGKNVDPNVTQLAESFYMTRSAISKLTKKLVEKQLIESYQKPDNRKEVYFRLTEQGKAINDAHQQLHIEYRQRDHTVFEQITPEELAAILRFTQSYNQHLDEEIAKLNTEKKWGYCGEL